MVAMDNCFWPLFMIWMGKRGIAPPRDNHNANVKCSKQRKLNLRQHLHQAESRESQSSENERQIYCRANVLRVKGDIRIRIMMSVTGLRVKYGRPSFSLSYLIYAGTTSPLPFRPCTPLEVSQQSSGQGPASLSSGPVPTALFSRIQHFSSKGTTHL